ncbi:hypothetical protein BUALT_Bualt15G0131100 [Buddleja alternifolia]|uniref:FAF domain-containing protein n=1 Tax=Buddleja alternifolia TaxID=168488 RepID=A0AAV6WMJ4_9LAMI|nr:hypothetical protein BUALT_Bualt15G0131100 [Buddleja alternifolia]
MHSPESDHHELCDCIGEESSIDLKSDVDTTVHVGGIHRRRRRRAAEAAEKEYPPPIPWLARTENLPSHMPWVMKKYYTSDGRLIIKEEKVKRHEYFQAHRSNGRLLLNLVAVQEGCKERRHAGEQVDDDPAGNPSEVVINGEDQEIRVQTVDKTLPECYRSCNGSIGGNPCGGFGMAVPAFTPPLHT